MRPPRDFQAGSLYGVTQRGDQGQWVYRDSDDFTRALLLMRRYAARHGVLIHGWCLMHDRAQWIFEASSETSISDLMRDMQGRYSRYLNRKYQKQPWLLVVPLQGRGRRKKAHYSRYRKAGPQLDAEV